MNIKTREQLPHLPYFTHDSVKVINSHNFPASGGGGGGNTPTFSNVGLLVTNEGSDASTPSPAVVGGTITYKNSAALTTGQNPTGQSSSLTCSFTGPKCITLDANSDTSWSGDFTVELWFRCNGTNNNNGRLFDIGDRYFSLLVNGTTASSTLSCDFARVSGGGPSISVGSQNLGTTWHHIALIRSGSDVDLYLDGSSIGSDTNSATVGLSSGSAAVTIGANKYGAERGFEGEIGPVRCSSEALDGTAPTLPLPES